MADREGKADKENLLRQVLGVAKAASRTQRWVAIAVLAVLVVLLVFLLTRGTTQSEYYFSSQLTEALDIAELSTSEFIYNGVALVHDPDSQKILYRIAYHSTIKVGIQMSDIAFDIDEEQKTVKPVLPSVTLQSPVVDPSSIDYLPNAPKGVDLQASLAACKENAYQEAEYSGKLIQLAEENMRSIVEALLSPVVENAGYRIAW